MITDILFYYNSKCTYSTTKMISREVLFNFKNKEMIDKINYKYREVKENFIQNFDSDAGNLL